MPKKTTRKSSLWLLVAIALLLVVGSSGRLVDLWFNRERVSFLFDWDAVSPIADNLAHSLHFDWGRTFSITEHHDPDKDGYIGITYRQWRVGPLMWRRVIYQRPGSAYR